VEIAANLLAEYSFRIPRAGSFSFPLKSLFLRRLQKLLHFGSKAEKA
jgi:hypothetical protein